ncbi:MAG: hypothetical protein AB1746_05615 [Candidatus Zixiibacteriota bacterium]
MEFDVSIFKPYDIRGNVPNQLNSDIAYRIGNGLAAFLKPRTLAVGRGRSRHALELTEAIIGGITDFGCDIMDLGEISPDIMNFAIGKYSLDGGVIICPGSGNADEIEIRFTRKHAMPLSGRHDLDQVRIALENDIVKKSPHRGNTTRKDITQPFCGHCLSFVDKFAIKPLKVIVNAHGGVAGDIVSAILNQLPVKIDSEIINTELSKYKIPESAATGGTELGRIIIEKKADLGAAFDPAAGRISIYDCEGKKISGDMLTALIAEYFLGKYPGENILYSLICSRAIPELIENKGGRAIRTRVGPSLIRPMMKKHNAVFGGEPSGYYYYRNNWFADSAMITFLVCLEIISRNRKSLGTIIKSFDRYFRSGEISLHINSVREKIELVSEKYASGQQDRLDGLSIDMGDFWFNIRSSNTEPVIRLNVEAVSKESLTTELSNLLKILRTEYNDYAPTG